MPRKTDQREQTNVERAKAYAKANKFGFDASYHLLLSAMAADGVAPRGVDPAAPAESELSSEDRARLSAARAELNFSGGGE